MVPVHPLHTHTTPARPAHSIRSLILHECLILHSRTHWTPRSCGYEAPASLTHITRGESPSCQECHYARMASAGPTPLHIHGPSYDMLYLSANSTPRIPAPAHACSSMRHCGQALKAMGCSAGASWPHSAPRILRPMKPRGSSMQRMMHHSAGHPAPLLRT
jgi:hypothetical protein